MHKTETTRIFRLAGAAAPAFCLALAMAFGGQISANAAEGINLFPRSLASQFKDNVQNAIFFGFDSSALTPGARDVLRHQAAWILEHDVAKLAITGFTDGVGNVEYNDKLAKRRAQAVAKYLSEQGVALDRIRIKVRLDKNPIEMAGLSARDAGRRAETRILGFAGPNVGSEELVGRILSWVPLAPDEPIETVDGSTSIASSGDDTGGGDTGGDTGGGDTGGDTGGSEPTGPGNSGGHSNSGGNGGGNTTERNA